MEPTSTVWISLFWRMGFEVLQVLAFEVLVHKLFVKDGPSARPCPEADHHTVESNRTRYRNHVWVVLIQGDL